MKRIIVILIGCSLSACSTLGELQLDTNSQKGRILLAGDREGVRALMDGLNGLVVTGKAKAGTDNPFSELRRHQDMTERYSFQVKKPTIH